MHMCVPARPWRATMQVRSRPLGGVANPAFVDSYIFTDLSRVPAFTRRYVDVEGLSPGKGYQVRHEGMLHAARDGWMA